MSLQDEPFASQFCEVVVLKERFAAEPEVMGVTLHQGSQVGVIPFPTVGFDQGIVLTGQPSSSSF